MASPKVAFPEAAPLAYVFARFALLTAIASTFLMLDASALLATITACHVR